MLRDYDAQIDEALLRAADAKGDRRTARQEVAESIACSTEGPNIYSVQETLRTNGYLVP